MNAITKASSTMKPFAKTLAVATAVAVTVGAALVAHQPGHNEPVLAATHDAPVVDPALERSPVLHAGVASDLDRTGASAAGVMFDAHAADQYAVVSNVATMGPMQQVERRSQADAEQQQRDKGKVAPRDKMSAPVAALLAGGAVGDAELVVRYDQRPELFDDARVAELGGEVVRSYEHLDMRAIRLPVAALESLASEDNVDWLSLDDEMSATSVSSRAAANLPSGKTGNAVYGGLNVGIAVLDTGVSSHADLSKDIVQYSFLNGAYPTPTVKGNAIAAYNADSRYDGFGHGTHVAGLLSGNGANSGLDYVGAARSAKLLSLQVLDANGGGSMSDVMAALDWLLTYGKYFDIRVVNLSLGKGISESNATDPLVLAVERLWDAGMVVVVAAGNEGYEGSMTVTSPGNSRKVITVGSITDNDTGTDHSDDYVSSFSSQGPTIGDYVLKPDLLAPGNRLVGAVAKSSTLAKALKKRLKACKKDCGEDVYLEMSGTSMAAPMVSAAAALMLDKDPTLSPATVKARLMRSAHKISADPTEAGAGLLDVEAAMDDSGVVSSQALSPLMVFDYEVGGVLIEDTAVLWGDDTWSSAYLFSGGVNWTSGATYTDENGVTAKGYMWTDGGVNAKGYMWTDGGVSAKGYMWTDGVNAKSLLDGNASTEFFLNDDQPQ